MFPLPLSVAEFRQKEKGNTALSSHIATYGARDDSTSELLVWTDLQDPGLNGSKPALLWLKFGV